MPVIVGAPRSGTTLLRFMLDAHPDLTIPPETGFLPAAHALMIDGGVTRERLYSLITNFPEESPNWEDFGIDREEFRLALNQIELFNIPDAIRAFYRLYARNHYKARYGEKTPTYCEHMEQVSELLPEAHFIHIIRDGRDVALSLRPLWFAPGRDMKTLASYWTRLVCTARTMGRTMLSYMELRYEDLVTDPATTLGAVCRFVDLPFDDQMLRYWEGTPARLLEHRERTRRDGSVAVSHQQRLQQQELTMQAPRTDRAGQWKERMTTDEQAEFARYGGDTLTQLGYSLSK